MKVRHVLISTVLVLVGSFSALGQDTLTVMSYNIFHAENPRTAESTIGSITDLINEVKPDFVALQEVDEQTQRLANLNNKPAFSLIDSLAVLTSMNGYFGKTIDFEGGEYGLGVLSKKSLKAHKLMLPNPKEGEPRILFYLEDENILFANTHLDHQFSENRLAQQAMLNDSLGQGDKSVILAGDFNFTPQSLEYKAIESKWIDAAAGSQGQNLDNTFPLENPTKRIDYIFLSKNAKWEVIDCRVLDVPFSDHLPVVAKVVVVQ